MKSLFRLFVVFHAFFLCATEDMHQGHHQPSTEPDKTNQSPNTPMPMHHMMMALPLDLPMARDGSGTSWQPDQTPLSMIMAQALGWHFMFHGNVFVGGQIQSSKRGDRDFNSINWFMASASHRLWSGQLSLRSMISLEPLTMRGEGYPLLLQSGESWRGEPLHDRQHPHDLFMELAVRYSMPIHEHVGLEFYGAVAGEPALGPVAFPHRGSSRSNPLAPLGHHWYDSTHVTFGVVTVGIFGRIWKAEGSWFNGREPDENRFNIDLRPLDSFSGRLSLNPLPSLSLQASYGFLKSPESKEPDVSVHRVTSSIAHAYQPWKNGNLSSALIFGINIPSSGKKTAFGLIEADFDLTRHHTIFGRAELGGKTSHDLVLDKTDLDRTFLVSAISLGYAFRFPELSRLILSLGGLGTLNFMDGHLGEIYGGQVQPGAMIYMNLRPADVY